MNIKDFWQLIDDARQAAGGDPQRQSQLLRAALADTTAETIIAFDDIFRDLRDRAYRAELWEAVFVIEGGCSNDCFAEFREWLIGRGEAIYDRALTNPESLAEVVGADGPPYFYSTLLSVAQDAYERLAGRGMPVRYRAAPELHGELHDENFMLARFPALKAKYFDR